jgi:hypothetical protein
MLLSYLISVGVKQNQIYTTDVSEADNFSSCCVVFRYSKRRDRTGPTVGDLT